MDKRWENSKLTIGYEWETILLDEYGLPLKFSDIENFIAKVRKEIPKSRTGVDWVPGFDRALYEIRSGITRNREELENRTEKTVKTTLKFAKEENYRFLPLGSFPPLGSAVGLHIHVGSWEKSEGLQECINSILPYLPCFAALSANSPFWGMNPGNPPFGVKSYRLKNHAQLMSIPSYTKPGLSFLGWESDITLKFYKHPTIEIRICDAPLSWKLLCEITSFITAFVLESLKKPRKFDKKKFIEGIYNRLRAMKYGLQALFIWEGKEREVTDIIREMIEFAHPTLNYLGYDKLSLIEEMLKKKQTQADFLYSLFENYEGDLYSFTTYLANILNLFEDPFRTYLEYAPELIVEDLMDIDEYILSMIGERTKYGRLYFVLFQTTDEFERKVWELEDKKLIDIDFDDELGSLFTKL